MSYTHTDRKRKAAKLTNNVRRVVVDNGKIKPLSPADVDARYVSDAKKTKAALARMNPMQRTSFIAAAAMVAAAYPESCNHFLRVLGAPTIDTANQVEIIIDTLQLGTLSNHQLGDVS
jgi:hypothetical protein